MATHVDLKAAEEFLRNKTYPKGILKDKEKNLISEKHAKTSALSMGIKCKKKNEELYLKKKEEQRCTRRNRRQFKGQSLGSSSWP